jgi:hypothetical protein
LHIPISIRPAAPLPAIKAVLEARVFLEPWPCDIEEEKELKCVPFWNWTAWKYEFANYGWDLLLQTKVAQAYTHNRGEPVQSSKNEQMANIRRVGKLVFKSGFDSIRGFIIAVLYERVQGETCYPVSCIAM